MHGKMQMRFLMILLGCCMVVCNFQLNRDIKVVNAKSNLYVINAQLGYDNNHTASRHINRANVTVYNYSDSDFNGFVSVLVLGDNKTSGSIVTEEIQVEAHGKNTITFGVYFVWMPDKVTFVLKNEDKEPVTNTTVSVKKFLSAEMVIGVMSDKNTDLGENNAELLEGCFVRLTEKEFPEDETLMDMFDILLVEDFNLSKLNAKQFTTLNEWIADGGTVIVDNLNDYIQDNINEFGIGANVDSDGLHMENKGEHYYRDNNMAFCYFNQNQGVIMVMEKAVAKMESDSLVSVFGSYYGKRANEKRYPDYIKTYQGLRMPMGKIPSLFFIICIFVIYILVLIVTTRYFSNKKGKQQLIWTVIPVVSIGFALLIYILGGSTRVGNVHLMHNTILEYSEDSSIARGTSYMTVCNPNNKTFHMMIPNGMKIWQQTGSEDGDIRTQKEDDLLKATEIDYANNSINYNGFSAFEYVDFLGSFHLFHSGSYEADIRCYDYDYSGMFTNNMGQTIKKACFLAGRRLYYLGDIKDGESVYITEKTPNTLLPDATQINVDGVAKTWLSFGEKESRNEKGEGYLSTVASYLGNGSEQRNCMESKVIGIMENQDGILGYWNANVVGATISSFAVNVDYTRGNTRFVCDLVGEGDNFWNYVDPANESEDYNEVECTIATNEKIASLKYLQNANELREGKKNFEQSSGIKIFDGEIQLYNYRTKAFETVFKEYGDQISGEELAPYVSRKQLRMRYVWDNDGENDNYLSYNAYRPIISAVMEEGDNSWSM